MKNKKLFVGGYYDERIFKGEEFEGKTPFGKDIDTYTLEEVLKLGFVENVKEWYGDVYEENWEDATEKEKIEAILKYVNTDEIAGLEYFDATEEAERYKNEVLEEIKDIENNSVYTGKTQDDCGYFREVYIFKNDKEEFIMNKKEIITKLIELGWELEEGYDGIEDDETNLSNIFNLSATICDGDYTAYDDGKIISELWIKYTIYPFKESCEYVIWSEGENPANCVPEGDDFEAVLDEALDDELFQCIDFPEFETIINSDNKLRREWYDLVRMKEKYTNSLRQNFDRGQYFIHWINNCNSNGESVYYPVSEKEAQAIIDQNDIDAAVEKMKGIVEK